MIIRCAYVLGSQAFSEARFGQGTGPIVLDDVECNSAVHRHLLECPSLIRQHNCRHTEDAGVACSGLKRAVEGNVSVAPVRKPSTMYTEEVFLTWEQRGNSQLQEQASFRVECTSRLHSVTVSVVSNQSFTTPIGGLLPSTSYNCCVSALYENRYTGEGTCMLIETQTSITQAPCPTTPLNGETVTFSNIVSAQPQVIGGVLGVVIILLLVLLVLMGIALGCVLRTKAKKDTGYYTFKSAYCMLLLLYYCFWE